ncbi:hypothetical protein KAI46_11540 [bacterium]|nr:hypothetical protein [bacterium]
MRKRFSQITLSLLLMLIIATTGCSFNLLKKDLDEQRSLVKISGTVTSLSPTTAPIMVLLLTNDPLQPKLGQLRDPSQT